MALDLDMTLRRAAFLREERLASPNDALLADECVMLVAIARAAREWYAAESTEQADDAYHGACCTADEIAALRKVSDALRVAGLTS